MKGSDIIRQEIEGGELGAGPVTSNVVLVPVATIGCGKTTVALALVKLFRWGHVQNDNIKGLQRRPQRFAVEICNSMQACAVTIADRNNHQKRERQQLIADVQRTTPDSRFVALHYVHDRRDYDQIRTVTRERVLSRGDNHQTIQAGSKDQNEIIGIMEGFLNRFQPVNLSEPPDDAFDLVINLDVTSSSRENLETVVAKMYSEYPKLFEQMPTASELDDAIEWALKEYRPDIKHDLGRGSQKKPKPSYQAKEKDGKTENGLPFTTKPKAVEYFCIGLPAAQVSSVLEAMFKGEDAETARFYRQLVNSRRIQPEFHVTLIHRAASAANRDEWDRLKEMHDRAKEFGQNLRNGDVEIGNCRVQLERLVWDSRVMCFVVRLLNEASDGAENVDGADRTDRVKAEGFRTVNAVAHITVGTAHGGIKPKESNDLLQRWLKDGSGDAAGTKEMLVKGHVVFEGTVKAVLQKY